VPYLAEACIVDLVGEDDTWQRVVSQSDDSRIQSRLDALATDLLSWDDPWRAIDVMRSGSAEIVTEVTDDFLEAHTDSPARLARLKAMGIRSALFVPLVARDHALGVVTLLRLADAEYSTADLELARALGTRAANALDNARLYAMAMRATRAREDVLSVVSHDLGNPLAAIRLCAAALMTSPPSEPEEKHQLMQAIGNSADWMTRLIQDLLDVSTIERGRLSVEKRTEVVRPILEQAAAMFAPQLADRGVTLAVDVPADVPAVFGDSARLVQVLANLVGNSLKYTDRGGTITLSAASVGNEVQIAVRDTGSGIPAEQLPRVFERYYTRRRGASKRGSGLGLSIARGIVEAHGGRIWAESVEGVGTTIRMALPAAG
jgi:signal transduction histidine kinase